MSVGHAAALRLKRECREQKKKATTKMFCLFAQWPKREVAISREMHGNRLKWNSEMIKRRMANENGKQIKTCNLLRSLIASEESKGKLLAKKSSSSLHNQSYFASRNWMQRNLCSAILCKLSESNFLWERLREGCSKVNEMRRKWRSAWHSKDCGDDLMVKS